MSSIRTTKSGNYQTDVRDKEGKRIRMTFASRAEANAFCSKIEKEKHVISLLAWV